jgi:hypothetical protein
MPAFQQHCLRPAIDQGARGRFHLGHAAYRPCHEEPALEVPDLGLHGAQKNRATVQGSTVEGFAVDHIHIHLMPLTGAGQLNPEHAKPADHADLAKLADRIRQ